MKNVHSYLGFQQKSVVFSNYARLVKKILETCERIANLFLYTCANYTYMYNLHTVCKSAHVNGDIVQQRQPNLKSNCQLVCLKNKVTVFVYGRRRQHQPRRGYDKSSRNI